jgi:hypothetical protein
MPFLNVRMVYGDDDPVAGERVMIVIHHSLRPPTNLTERTDSDGVAKFDFESGESADVYVRGSLRLQRAGLDDEVSVSV